MVCVGCRDRLPSTHHCNLISHIKKNNKLSCFDLCRLVLPKRTLNVGCCGVSAWDPSICQSPLSYFLFCLLSASPGLPSVTWLSDKDSVASARDYQMSRVRDDSLQSFS